MSDKISKYKTELKALTEQNKENERRAKNEQMKQKQLNEGLWNRLFEKNRIKCGTNISIFILAKEKLNQMKKQKVDMVKQMKEEAKQAREKEKEV